MLKTLPYKIQKVTVWVLAGLLDVIVLLSTAHLGFSPRLSALPVASR